ncbi:MAG: hypothetical protein ACLQHK_14085 [Gallionellaceae bacterium]
MVEIDNKHIKNSESNFSTSNVVFGLLLAAIIANHFLWAWHYAVSVPEGDDYVQILNRLIIFHNIPSGFKPEFFFGFSGGQHRLVFLNLVIVALYEMTRNIDFQTLILIGNCSLLVLLLGIWKYAGLNLPHKANRIGYFLPVSLLVLSPAYFEASLWATGVLSNLPVLAFAFLAIVYAQQRSGFAFLAGLLAALLASGTLANGMAVFLTCAAMLASQQRYTRALLMLLLFIAVAWAYTRGFPSVASNSANPITTSIGRALLFFLALCGALVWGKYWAIFFGALLVAGFGVLTWRGLPKRNPVLWGLGLFLLLSMAMMSLGRTDQGLGAALLSRYKPYSGLMVVVVYLGSLLLAPSIAWGKIIGIAGILISSVSYFSYLINYGEAITDFGFHPKLRMAYRSIEGKVQVLSGFPGTDFANYVIDTAERYRAYRPPLFSELVLKPTSPSEGTSPATAKQQNQTGTDFQIYEFIDGEKATLVYGGVDEKCAFKPFRIILKNGAKTLYFDTQPPDFGWLNIRPTHGLFGGIVDKRSLPAGQYQLGGVCGNNAPTFLGDSYRVSKNT